MNRSWRKLVWVFGLVLAGLCLWLAFRGVSFDELRRAFANIDYTALLLAYLTAIAGIMMRVLQWHFVLRSTKRIAFIDLLSPIMIGFFCNFVLPVRLGELVRARLTSRKEGLSFATVLTTVLLTRIFDGLALLALLAYVVFFSGLLEQIDAPQSLLRPISLAAYSFGGMCITLLIACITVALFQKRAYRLAGRVGNWLGRHLSTRMRWVERAVEHGLRLLKAFIDGLRMFRHAGDMMGAIAASLAVWVFGALTARWVFLAFDVDLPISVSLFVMVTVAIGIALPGAPGYLGQFHAACRYALAVFAVPAPAAASIATCLHALHFSYTAVLGGIFLVREKLTWAQIRETGARPREYREQTSSATWSGHE